MLISVFGVWLMATNIAYLHNDAYKCDIVFSGKPSITINNTCDQVAVKINEQIYLNKAK